MKKTSRKSHSIDLSDFLKNRSKITIGLGWNERITEGETWDCDSSVLLLQDDGRCHSSNDICYYNPAFRNLHEGAVVHHGDNRTGQGVGDDEKISVDLDLIPTRIASIIIVISIYQGFARKQNFGQIDDAYIRIMSDETGDEITSFDLSEEAPESTAVEIGRLERTSTSWKFTAIQTGSVGGLAAVLEKYGLKVKK